MSEKRRNYTDEFKREAMRLVTEHGDGVSAQQPAIWGSMRRCGVAGNVSLKRNNARHFQGTGGCRSTRRNYTGYATKISDFAWQRDILKTIVVKLTQPTDL